MLPTGVPYIRQVSSIFKGNAGTEVATTRRRSRKSKAYVQPEKAINNTANEFGTTKT